MTDRDHLAAERARKRAYLATPEGREAKRAADARYRAKRRRQETHEPVEERLEPPPTPSQWAPSPGITPPRPERWSKRSITPEERVIDGLEPSPAAEDDLSELVATPVEPELPDAHLAERPRRDPFAIEHTGYRYRLAYEGLQAAVGPGVDLLGRTEVPYWELYHLAKAKERRAEAARRKAEAELDQLALDHPNG